MLAEECAVDLDMISLFPEDTWKGREKTDNPIGKQVIFSSSDWS
jgi:hypothetical protein